MKSPRYAWSCSCGMTSGVVTFHWIDTADRDLQRHVKFWHQGELPADGAIVAPTDHLEHLKRYGDSCEACSDGVLEYPEGSGG